MPKHNTGTKDNFGWMLGTIVLLLFSSALAENILNEVNVAMINAGIAVTLLVAVWSLNTARLLRGSRIVVSLILLAALTSDLTVDRFSLELINLSILIVLLMVASGITAKQVLFPLRVDANVIIGAMVLYLLMGLLWAIAYLLVEALSPGAIRGLEDSSWQDNLQTMIYYSFVTLSTLGYGDLSPQQPVPQFLAYMEAIVGQFYLSVLVASLISASFSQRAQSVAE